MPRLDLKKQLKAFYAASAKEVRSVDVPPMRYLMVDGRGDPNTAPEYVQAVEALFTVSYATKFAVKRGPLAVDYGVMPLEGLWWADDHAVFSANDRTRWQWTMMIHQPALVPDEVIHTAMADAAKRKALPALPRLRLETFTEGLCAQVLHVGPFSEEGPTIERLHAFIADRGALSGKHHEIYLSDVRRAAPERWKTIIRQPMRGGLGP
ncbi:MAG: GyrI-like domain-containing protein [Verrucomicrobiota bacterium]